jgi:myo-inositol-1(or 4)-monophosphatase
MPVSDPILAHLKSMFDQVRQAVLHGNPAEWGRPGHNAKGDAVKWFDLAADRAVCAYLAKHFPAPVLLLSEEGEPRHFGAGEAEYILVLDPVDGSENFARNIPLSGMAAALIPAHLPVNVQSVQYALVGNLFSGHVWLARRGGGAFYNDAPLSPPRYTAIEQALISFDSNKTVIDPRLAAISVRAHGLRSLSAAAVVLAMVADGTLGAHLDLSGKLTPENFLASALLVTEAGGVITDDTGRPLPDIPALTNCYRVIAAATPELHVALVEAVQR